MARPSWSGSISFGLVNVPVKAYAAVREHTVHFNQLDKRTGARIRYEKVSAKTGKEVPAEQIERGFEVRKGEYVVVDPEEFDELRPERTRRIDIEDFVELEAVDPIYYGTTYWLAAAGGDGQRSYRLLLTAMEEIGRVGIGSVVMHNKQYLAAIRPLDGALAMSTLHFADEIVDRRDIEGIPTSRTKVDPKQLKLAEQIVESMASGWDPSRYHDTYTEEMRDLIARKAKGEELTVEPSGGDTARVLDLVAALEASVAERRRSRSRPAKKARRAYPARAAKKATKRRSA